MVMYRRGDVVDVDLGNRPETAPIGLRPCVIVQDDTGNQFSSFTIVVSLTPRRNRKKLGPGDVEIVAPEGGLDFNRVADCNQIAAVDKRFIIRWRGALSKDTIAKIDQALKVCLALK